MPDEFESGFFDESRLGKAWHGAGNYVAGAQNSTEAKRLSGLADWDLRKLPIFTQVFKEDGTVETITVPGRSAVVRMTDHSVLGDVGEDYGLIDNELLFDLTDTLVVAEKGNEAEARYHSAGSLRRGRRVWVLMDMPGSGFSVGNEKDKIIPYLLVTNAHDGSASCKIIPTTVRVVCMNTLSAALDGRYKEISVNIRHSGDIKTKVGEAQLMLAKASGMFKAFAEVGNQLNNIKVTRETYEELIDTLFPPLTNDATDNAKQRRNNTVKQLTAAVQEERALLPQFTKTSEAMEGFSYWTLLNGVTRFSDHVQKVRVANIFSKTSTAARTTGEARFESNWLGSGAQLKEKAAAEILKLADIKK